MPAITAGCVRTRMSLLPWRSCPWSRKRSPRNAASSSLWRWTIVPMPPSRTRMRSCSSAVRRAVVGSIDIGDSIPLGLVRQGGDDVQVRRAPLARRHLAAVDDEAGALGEPFQRGGAEARLHVTVLRGELGVRVLVDRDERHV